MSYDPACEDLAKYFIGDLSVASPKHVASLAQCIQDRIEDWLEYEQRELDARELDPRGSL